MVNNTITPLITRLNVVITSKCISVSNQYTVHLKPKLYSTSTIFQLKIKILKKSLFYKIHFKKSPD